MTTFTIYESNGLTNRTPLRQNIETFEEAEAIVRMHFDLVMFEADVDHPGCADALTTTGRIICIEQR